MKEEEFDRFISYQIMTDYLMTNTDRHMNNIAIMRDPDTLQILGFAPIYDSGNSMFYNLPYDKLSTVRLSEIKTHSFLEKEVRLLQYVQDRHLVDADKAAAQNFDVYKKDISERHPRIPLLEELYERKLNSLKAFQNGRDLWKDESRRYQRSSIVN